MTKAEFDLLLKVAHVRGTTEDHATYVGRAGTLSINTTTNRIHLHDGQTVGGVPAASLADIDAVKTLINELDISKISGLQAELDKKVNADNFNKAGGWVKLDASGHIPSSLVPNSLEEVIEYTTVAELQAAAAVPGTLATGKLYVITSEAKDSALYRFVASVANDGTGTVVKLPGSTGTTDDVVEGVKNLYFTAERARAAISFTGEGVSYDPATGVCTINAAVISVNGKKGEVVLTKEDVGLGKVENYAVATNEQMEALVAPDAYVTPAGLSHLFSKMGFTHDANGWLLDSGVLTGLQSQPA